MAENQNTHPRLSQQQLLRHNADALVAEYRAETVRASCDGGAAEMVTAFVVYMLAASSVVAGLLIWAVAQ